MHNFLLLKRHRHRFFQQVVTDDEKWLLYVDYRRNRQWVNPEDLLEPEAKKDLYPKKK